jgi:hypothetical protein
MPTFVGPVKCPGAGRELKEGGPIAALNATSYQHLGTPGVWLSRLRASFDPLGELRQVTYFPCASVSFWNNCKKNSCFSLPTLKGRREDEPSCQLFVIVQMTECCKCCWTDMELKALICLEDQIYPCTHSLLRQCMCHTGVHTQACMHRTSAGTHTYTGQSASSFAPLMLSVELDFLIT